MPAENIEQKNIDNSPTQPGDGPISVPRTLFGGRFRVKSLIGSGGFGDVYRGVQENTGMPVAIKMEKITSRSSFLFHEARVMQDIQKRVSDGESPLALLKYFGQEGDNRMLIMNLMGPSLEDIHEKRRRFSLKTTLMLGIQMVSRLEYIHECSYIHRDLKPDNFVLGLNEDKNKIYLIDFGLSTRYRSNEGIHREEQTGKNFIGTARYASSRTHEGYSQSRRDDIEQLVYVLIYLYRGRLPWTGLQIQSRDEKERKIGSIKRCLPYSDICRGCPTMFVLLLNYARKMKYDEKPAYDMMRGLIRKQLFDLDMELDYIFDWDIEPKSPTQSQPKNEPAGGDNKNKNKKQPSNAELAAQGSLQVQSDADGCGILSGLDTEEIMSLEGASEDGNNRKKS